MRLAIVTSSYPSDPGDSANAGVFVREFALALQERGHEMDVVTPQRAVAGADPIRVRSFWWPGRAKSLTHLSSRNLLNVVRFGILLVSGMLVSVRLARRRQVDHVMAMWAIPSGLMALAVRKVTGVSYSVWALGSDIWRVDDYPFGRALLRRVLVNADRVYADGMALAREVESISGRECTFLASSRRLPLPSEREEAVGSSEDAHILCVARHHRHKGVDVLVEAVALLPEAAREHLRLSIYGEGPDTPALRSRVEEAGLSETVSFEGLIDARTLGRELAAATCIAIPSRTESIPVILSDAAQAGCPVIVSDVGDMGDLVRRFRAGRVVPPESPEALVAALESAISGGLEWDRQGLTELAELLDVVGSAERFSREAGGEPHDRGSEGPGIVDAAPSARAVPDETPEGAGEEDGIRLVPPLDQGGG